MTEPVYAVHDRVAVRRAQSPEGSKQRASADLYLGLVTHVLRHYPEPGPLRSMALRKLAESLNDLLDHEALVLPFRNRAADHPHPLTDPYGRSVPPGASI